MDSGKGVAQGHLRSKSGGKTGQIRAFGRRCGTHLLGLNAAAKYTQDYLGVSLAAMAGRLWKTDGEVLVYIAHPPGDVEYRHELMAACGEEWVVEVAGRRMYFNFSQVYTWEEPVGGVMNVLLTADGTHYQNPEIAEGRTLVIDIGGGTTDLSGIFPDGRLDLSVQESIPIGINDVYKDLERSLRKRYAKFFKNVRQIPQARHSPDGGWRYGHSGAAYQQPLA